MKSATVKSTPNISLIEIGSDLQQMKSGPRHLLATSLHPRINKNYPHVLEMVEFCSFAKFPRIGLRIEFANTLRPFAFICKNELSSASGNQFLLYVLTVAGVAYLIKLKDITNYASCSIFPPNEVVELNIQSYCHYGAITAVAATTRCLVIGGSDGSIGCFQLGILDPSIPGFLHELRDDSSFGRLWNLMSRSLQMHRVMMINGMRPN